VPNNAENREYKLDLLGVAQVAYEMVTEYRFDSNFLSNLESRLALICEFNKTEKHTVDKLI
jgi:hypothetical protein